MTSPANVGSFVVPGTTVDVNDDDTLGSGVIQASNGPVATVVGTLSRADGVLFVNQKRTRFEKLKSGMLSLVKSTESTRRPQKFGFYMLKENQSEPYLQLTCLLISSSPRLLTNSCQAQVMLCESVI